MNNLCILDKAREDLLWNDSLIVFDTSSLCAFYDMTKDARDSMVEILEYLKDRIWLPAQVVEEYAKNRVNVITNPIREKYQNLEFLKNDRMFLDGMKTFIERHKSVPYFHPFIAPEALEKLESDYASLTDLLKGVKDTIGKEYKERKGEIQELKDNDSLCKEIYDMPKGIGFSMEELIAIVREGEFRYRNTIPPGYMDDPKFNRKSDKKGIRIYGDLIIWKEIIAKAAYEHKSVIFVCNDMKEDWYVEHKDEKKHTPRIELLKEFVDTTGQDIWFYDLNQFVKQLETRYKSDGLLEGLDAVISALAHIAREKRFAGYRRDTENIWLLCDACKDEISIPLKDIDWWWDSDGSSERSMGPETEWVCEYECECPACLSDGLRFKFRIWEYPVGAFNYQTIELEGGVLLNNPSISSFIEFEDRQPCEICGTYDVLDEYGMCEFCRSEMKRKMEED